MSETPLLLQIGDVFQIPAGKWVRIGPNSYPLNSPGRYIVVNTGWHGRPHVADTNQFGWKVSASALDINDEYSATAPVVEFFQSGDFNDVTTFRDPVALERRRKVVTFVK